jgi:hypothetical protein
MRPRPCSTPGARGASQAHDAEARAQLRRNGDDGFEGMEGNGPASRIPVASSLALTSTDYIAADRVDQRKNVMPWSACLSVPLYLMDAAHVDSVRAMLRLVRTTLLLSLIYRSAWS